MPRRKKSQSVTGSSSVSNLFNKSKDKKNHQPVAYDGRIKSLIVKQSEILGRYVVAERLLKPGEIVLKDEAIVVGPCQESQPLCIGCYVNVNLKDFTTYQRCKNCGWPLCSTECSGYHAKYGHSKDECYFLSKSFAKDKPIEAFADYYYAVTPFRCLLLKEKNPKMWNLVKDMEAHMDARKKSVELWTTNRKMAVDVIQKAWGFSQFSESEIHFVCGVLEVNAFEVNIPRSFGPQQQCLRAIYPNAFLFAHDCVPNTCSANGENFEMTFRTLREVKANDIVTISYAYTLQSTLKRREHLEKTKFFSCNCQRCSDPTELNTFAGAMKCQNCERGWVLPENPLNNKTLWKCNFSKCQTKIEVSQINPLLEKLFNKLDAINGNDIKNYELYLNQCEKILHKNHYLCLSAMHCLSRLYGKIDGYLINDLPDELLERKIEICERLIWIFKKLQPGLSKEKGILCYEVHAPLMVLLRRKYENKSISTKDMKLQIRKIVNYLEEAILILSKEPEFSEERQICEAADEALKMLKYSY